MTIEKLSWICLGKSYKMASEDERHFLEEEFRKMQESGTAVAAPEDQTVSVGG
jgi:hypothetical protein